VYELRAIGRDSKAAEDLLSQFERSQEIFERELAAFSWRIQGKHASLEMINASPRRWQLRWCWQKLRTKPQRQSWNILLGWYYTPAVEAAQCHCPVLKLWNFLINENLQHGSSRSDSA
jgi:hypothetical protein